MTKFEASQYCHGNIYGEFNQQNQDEYLAILKQLTGNHSEKCDTCIAKNMCQNTCYAENLEYIGVLYGRPQCQCSL